MEPSKTIQERFLQTYDDMSDTLFRHFFFKISNRERAKDLVQETFTRAWEYIAVKGGEVHNLKSFLYTIAHNLIVDEYKRKKTVSLDLLQEEENFDVPEVYEQERILSNAETSRLHTFIKELPDKYRQVIVMRYVDGLSPSEIAEKTGDTENAISVRINRGIKKIQDLMHI
jgi:RNA polymerase sigma-70 factor (ECF subfamily)